MRSLGSLMPARWFVLTCLPARSHEHLDRRMTQQLPEPLVRLPRQLDVLVKNPVEKRGLAARRSS